MDPQGLWHCRDVWFSRHGTLLDTAAAWVQEAPAGYFARELEALLHVAVKDPLRTLLERARLSRHALDQRWLYCAKDRARQQEQRAARQAQLQALPLAQPSFRTLSQTEELKAALGLFYSLLDEHQRRLFAGRKVTSAGMAATRSGRSAAADIVAPGCGDFAGRSSRAVGRRAAPTRAEKNARALDALTRCWPIAGRRPDGGADPARTVACVRRTLWRLGLAISPITVRRLLDQLGVALRGNRRTLGGSGPERDRQFGFARNNGGALGAQP